MSERNGPDIAAVYQLLREVAQKVAEHDRRFDAIDRRFEAIDRRFDAIDRRFDQQDGKINEIVRTVNEHSRVLADIIAVLDRHEKKLDDLGARVESMREMVTLYNSAVIGHGIAISDLDERVRGVQKFIEEISARR